MKNFDENAVLQLPFNKSANLINLCKFLVIFFTKKIFDMNLPQISQKIES